MKRRIPAVLVMAAFAAIAPAAENRPAFDVASVKPAESLMSKLSPDGKLKIGLMVEGARVDLIFMSLADIIRQAYRLKSYQFEGPDWMSSERYDIHAKLPEGATKDQVPEMLQALLEERFKLAFHKSTKEHSVYALTVSKSGLKIQEVEPDPPGEPQVAVASAPPAQGNKPLTFTTSNGAITTTSAGNKAILETKSADGVRTVLTGMPGMHLDRKMTMSQLSEFLSRFVDKPVMDETQLKGTYGVVLDIPGEELLKMARSGNSAIVINATGGPLPVGASDSASDPSDGSAMMSAVQQMGLKLEKRKLPLEVLVAERAEKVPVDQ